MRVIVVAQLEQLARRWLLLLRPVTWSDQDRNCCSYFPASFESWPDEASGEALGCLPGEGTVTPTPAQLDPGVVPCPITPTPGRSLLFRSSVVLQAASSVSSEIQPISSNSLLIAALS